MEHTVRAFDEELGELSGLVTRLGQLAMGEVADAVLALTSRDEDLAQAVVARDHSMDELELDIEQRAVLFVARRQPVAVDLRRAVATMKMAGNLERCGDLAKNIAKRSLAMGAAEPILSLTPPLERLGDLVLRRLGDALQAYDRDDIALAAKVWRRDREVDEHYESLFRELLTHMMGDPRTITACTHLLFVAKNLERIGDHATNIAEVIHYSITGDQLTSRPKFESAEA